MDLNRMAGILRAYLVACNIKNPPITFSIVGNATEANLGSVEIPSRVFQVDDYISGLQFVGYTPATLQERSSQYSYWDDSQPAEIWLVCGTTEKFKLGNPIKIKTAADMMAALKQLIPYKSSQPVATSDMSLTDLRSKLDMIATIMLRVDERLEFIVNNSIH